MLEQSSPPKAATAYADATAGLSSAEAARRLAQYGRNTLAEHHTSVLERLFKFFWGPIPWMIEMAAVLSAAAAPLGRSRRSFWRCCSSTPAVGFWQEFKADNAIALLKQRLALKARVRRDGQWKDIAARLLVPGDVVLVKLGNIVPADLKLIGGAYLSVDQSALTGESLPVDKKVGDDAYSGSIAKQGEMTAAVTATGMNTYFGKTARSRRTGQDRLAFPARGAAHRQFPHSGHGRPGSRDRARRAVPPRSAARDLAIRADPHVASIPVALPAVLSVTMAIGAERLASFKAIVSRLVAIEEMAGMDMLCTDKTGTLTKNELTLGDFEPAPGVSASELMVSGGAGLAARRARRNRRGDPRRARRRRRSWRTIR